MEEFAVVRSQPDAPDGSTEIRVLGPVSHATTSPLRDYLRRVIDTSSIPRIRLDLSCCSSINVDGMLALSVAQHAARNRGGELHVVDVPPLIARQLREHNFDELLLDPEPGAR